MKLKCCISTGSLFSQDVSEDESIISCDSEETELLLLSPILDEVGSWDQR